MREIKWTKKKLGGKHRVAEIVNGATPSTDDVSLWDGDILWATPTDIGRLNSIYISNTERKITEKGFKSCSTKIIPANSVLMTSRAPVGNLAINTVPMCTNQGFKSFIVSEELDAHYLFFYLKHIVKQIEKDSHGNTFTEISKDQVEKMEVQLPENVSDQKRIASEIKIKLTSVEQMRQAALKQKEAVEALQGALLREVFTYKEGDELPKGWKLEKLDDVAKVNKLRKKKSTTTPKEPTSFVPMECVDDITGKITKTFLRPYDELGQSYTYFENGDVIFAKITPCMQNGKCAIVSEMKDGFGYGSSEYIVFTPSKPIYTKWVHYFLRTVELRKNAEDHFTGSAGQQRVPVDYLQKYKIPVPEDETLIEKLTDALDKKHEEYFNLITQTEAQLEAIEAMPAAILREVFDFNNPVNKKSGET